MNRTHEPTAGQSRSGNLAASLQEAKSDYYDCIARYGWDSAEAHVAQILWRKLRSKSRLGQLATA